MSFPRGAEAKRIIYELRYRRAHEVEAQVVRLLHQTPSLRGSSDTYVFNNGTSQRLLKVSGTVPITYQYNTYNIPVAFYLPMDFPGVAPMCYVTPTAGMKVKERHMHVGAQGFVYHPYLHGWNPRGSTLFELVGILRGVFGTDPPVYAVAAGRPAASRPAAARPPVGGGYAYGSQPAGASPYDGGPAAASVYGSGAAARTMYSGGSEPMRGGISKMHTTPPGAFGMSSSAKRDEEMDITLVKSTFEAQLKRHLEVLYKKENAEVRDLAEKRKSLEIHKKQLEETTQKLDAEQLALSKRREELAGGIDAMRHWLAANGDEAETEVDINELVKFSDPWSKQCMEAVAADYGITDVMLELDRALEDETLSLKDYLKQLRRLARDQFMKRALAQAVFVRQDALVQKARAGR